MITDFGIPDFWLYALLVSFIGVIIGIFTCLIGTMDGNWMKRAGAYIMVISFISMAGSGAIAISNDAEQFDADMETIQDSIDTTGNIPTQSALLCQMSDINTRKCNLYMFDWYMDTHYDPTSNASMRVAMEMRGNVG